MPRPAPPCSTRWTTGARSRWRNWSSVVGHDYACCQCFQDALQQPYGRYFAVGVTTGIPGYFLSHTVRDEDDSLRREQVELRGELMVEARVMGDAIRLEQVLLSLLNNALDALAGAERRVLTLRLERHGRTGC